MKNPDPPDKIFGKKGKMIKDKSIFISLTREQWEVVCQLLHTVSLDLSSLSGIGSFRIRKRKYRILGNEIAKKLNGLNVLPGEEKNERHN